MSDFEGRCLCGGVRFAVAPPTLFFAHCHCRWCREAHGAAFVTWIGFPTPQVTLTEGRELLRAHQSSPGTRRSFCAACGTKLFFESERWPGETHVTLAAFDDPVDREPSGHAFADEHVAWLPFALAPE